MSINRNKIEKIIGISAVVLAAAFVGLSIVAKKKKSSSVYDDEPEQKNPMEGKKVIFMEDDSEIENADGVRGHLEAVGESDIQTGCYGKYVKRTIDVILSFGGLVVLSPIFMIIIIAIKLDDPGPVLFTQKRVGKNKEYFKLHKFRSMKMNTPHDVPTHMLDNPEQYITKVGKFLRAHSLDELPQIWDIFIGNMSVIGPRPGLWNQDVLTAERDKYGANDVKPGLTGWAQINGRDELEISDKARLDGEYVKKMSLMMDLRVFLGSLHVFGKDETVVEGGTREKSKIGREYTDNKSSFELIGQIGFSKPVVVDKIARRKVLITGADSYVGKSFKTYAYKYYKDSFDIDVLNMLDPKWRETDFSNYDIVYHVAGIAHADIGNVSDDVKEKYYEVNTDLAVEVCKTVKEAGVKEFIFMSSMIVYGESEEYGKKKIIDKNTLPQPSNFYGDSKLQADVAVRELANENFTVIVLRPPMIYGNGSKGNYLMLETLAKKLPLFPDVDNERSMLYIDNLCEFLCQVMLVDSPDKSVVLIPQNSEWVNTSKMVKELSTVNGKKMTLLKSMKPIVLVSSQLPCKIGKLVKKAFGSMVYDHEMSIYEGIDYRISKMKDGVASIKKSYNKPRALMIASVASMIDLFNADNINILLELGYHIDVATNFEFGSITSQERVNEYKLELKNRGIDSYQVPIPRSLSMVKEIIQSYEIVKKLADQKEYKIVHCHSPIGSVICRMACRDARKKYGTKVIYTAHGFHFFNGAGVTEWAVFYPVENLCSYYTDILITINKEDYNNSQKLHAKKTVYVPGIGIHTDEFRNIAVDRRVKREEFGFQDNDFVFMSTGQISIRKNHEVVIRALAKIDNPTIKYLIVGFGELENKLKQLVKELKLEKRVVFAGYREDIKELLHSVEAYVFPSLQEGLPVALMEAMSVGLPVVCSKIRGNVDLIENGKGGFLCDCNDIDGFVEAMKKIVNGEANGMGLVNVETMKKFDIKVVNKKMKKLYQEL